MCEVEVRRIVYDVRERIRGGADVLLMVFFFNEKATTENYTE